MSTCDVVRLELGGYVLDGLTADERRRVDVHLQTCAGCQAELDKLAKLPPLLALVIEERQAPPRELRARVLTTAVRTQNRIRTTIAVAAAVLAGVAVVVIAWVAVPRPPAGPAVIYSLQAGEGFDTEGEVTFTDLSGELRIELALDGLPEPAGDEVFEAWLGVPSSEVPITIGELERDEDGSATMTLWADGSVDDYERFWVTLEPDSIDPAHDGPLVVGAMLTSPDTDRSSSRS